MKRKHKRLTFVAVALALLGVAAALVLNAFEDNIVFFYSPTEIQAKDLKPDQRLRLGGLVEDGSVEKLSDGNVQFRVTDTANVITVRFKGLLPDLFREGQGVIAEGHLKGNEFVADEVLAKHDENYMPPEVADAIKKSGQWKAGEKPK
jgi:cytochrome c-type biogenesis protein CcmE